TTAASGNISGCCPSAMWLLSPYGSGASPTIPYAGAATFLYSKTARFVPHTCLPNARSLLQQSASRTFHFIGNPQPAAPLRERTIAGFFDVRGNFIFIRRQKHSRRTLP